MTQKKILSSSIDEVNVLLSNEYKKAIKSLYSMLLDMYAKILDEDGKPLMSHLYSYSRYYSLIEKLNERLNVLGVEEEKILSSGLEDLYKDNEKLLNNKFNLSTHIDEDSLKKLISENWVGDGQNFSNRIWKDKTNMMNKLQSDLIQSITKGDNIQNYSDTLRNYLVKDGYYPTARLLRTEMSRVQLKCSLLKYQEAGIKKVRIVEAMDDRTCEICKERNNKVLEIATLDENQILAHPQCRATITPIIE